jgi:hypothetical protein
MTFSLSFTFWATAVVTSSMTLLRSNATDDDNAMTAFCCWPLQFQSRLGRFNGAPVGGTPGIFEVGSGSEKYSATFSMMLTKATVVLLSIQKF